MIHLCFVLTYITITNESSQITVFYLLLPVAMISGSWQIAVLQSSFYRVVT